ncbi:beta-lactamase family protein [Neobacillus mesonae]|nr:beta-lactamase family protein [Neobacillus mesonae]
MNSTLTSFVDEINAEGLNVFSIRVLQNGELLGEWSREMDIRRPQHSISKSFTCMAAGLAIEEGKLTLHSRLGDYFNYDSTYQSKEQRIPSPDALTLYDLLRMSSGHDAPPLWLPERKSLTEKDWAKYYLSLPLDRPPGELFTYSSGDTFMISAMIQAAVGETVESYLTPRLFEPLGIHDVEWESSPLGVTLGCAGLIINTEELSRFGQMLLDEGLYKGKQLIPAEWITFATSKHIDSVGDGDWSLGYGCQFWMCSHEAYRGDGAHGQLLVIIPQKRAVIAVNSEEDRIQSILDAVWKGILPILY